MLDGKAALPEQMKKEDAALLLDAAKGAREQFLQQGAEELNRFSREGPTPKGFLKKGYSMITGGSESVQDDSRWQIDPSAKDIYGEIDRALAHAHQAAATFQDGASGILAELKRRGCVQAGEEFSLDSQEPVDGGAAVRASLFQDIYEDIWSAFRQSVSGKEDQSIERKGP